MPYRLLFVDDEPRVLDALRRALRHKRGEWEMQFVTSGRDALEKMLETPFDVIVSDMMMPEMSGEQLLSEVKTRYPGTTRIVLSGQCDRDTACRLVGSDHLYLSKPCDRDVFIRTIEQAIQVGEATRKPLEPLTNAELTKILCAFMRNLLLKNLIHFDDVPEALRSHLSGELLDYFAPMVEDKNYVDQFLNVEESESADWLTDDDG